ncbi:Lsr2 dimerization domain-containing protein [Geodermatophilus siccatus]|uniref:Lsr2 dimerization domain-containing protein n=1 Tax=Geodermatophilus siccatus TaxID=1137991 RepID=UPI001FE12EB4|nr:histone-like nucleoid-structuring protein Lsr2 [Geodermatophilus siccatus]
MATKTQAVLVDDLTGDPADTTVKFASDKTEYQIDLSHENAAKMREGLSVPRLLTHQCYTDHPPYARFSAASPPHRPVCVSGSVSPAQTCEQPGVPQAAIRDTAVEGSRRLGRPTYDQQITVNGRHQPKVADGRFTR